MSPERERTKPTFIDRIHEWARLTTCRLHGAQVVKEPIRHLLGGQILPGDAEAADGIPLDRFPLGTVERTRLSFINATQPRSPTS
jgi:hypothetical protein